MHYTSDPEYTKNFKWDLLSKTYRWQDLRAIGEDVAEISRVCFPGVLWQMYINRGIYDLFLESLILKAKFFRTNSPIQRFEIPPTRPVSWTLSDILSTFCLSAEIFARTARISFNGESAESFGLLREGDRTYANSARSYFGDFILHVCQIFEYSELT